METGASFGWGGAAGSTALPAAGDDSLAHFLAAEVDHLPAAICNLAETAREPTATSHLLANRRGDQLTRPGISFLLGHYRRLASVEVPTLQRAGISPHTFRDTKAMHLLQAGESPVTIKDFLGHVHLKTLEVYVEADLDMKRRALESTPSHVKAGPRVRRHQPDLPDWLERL